MNAERRPEAASVAGWPADSFARRRRSSHRCEPMADGRRDPWRFTQSTAPGQIEASRAAWAHLAFLGLLDREGFVEGVLRDLGRAS